MTADCAERRLLTTPAPTAEDQDSTNEGHVLNSASEPTSQDFDGATVDGENLRAHALCIGDTIITGAGPTTVTDVDSDNAT